MEENSRNLRELWWQPFLREESDVIYNEKGRQKRLRAW
jgi:hypothetical protein